MRHQREGKGNYSTENVIAKLQLPNQTSLIQYKKHLSKLTNLSVKNCNSCSLHQHSHSKMLDLIALPICWLRHHPKISLYTEQEQMFQLLSILFCRMPFLKCFLLEIDSWDDPSVDCLLFSGLPGVLPWTTMGHLAAMIGQNTSSNKCIRQENRSRALESE